MQITCGNPEFSRSAISLPDTCFRDFPPAKYVGTRFLISSCHAIDRHSRKDGGTSTLP